MITQNKINWGLATIAVLEVLFLVGAYILDYFTRKRMGMARYVSNLNYSLEDKYPVQTLMYITIIILGILAVSLIIIFLLRRKAWNRKKLLRITVMILLTALFTGFALLNSRESQRSYYLVCTCYGIAAFLQIVTTGIEILRGSNET